MLTGEKTHADLKEKNSFCPKTKRKNLLDFSKMSKCSKQKKFLNINRKNNFPDKKYFCACHMKNFQYMHEKNFGKYFILDAS